MSLDDSSFFRIWEIMILENYFISVINLMYFVSFLLLSELNDLV